MISFSNVSYSNDVSLVIVIVINRGLTLNVTVFSTIFNEVSVGVNTAIWSWLPTSPTSVESPSFQLHSPSVASGKSKSPNFCPYVALIDVVISPGLILPFATSISNSIVFSLKFVVELIVTVTVYVPASWITSTVSPFKVITLAYVYP